jgi:hypothetical protein
MQRHKVPYTQLRWHRPKRGWTGVREKVVVREGVISIYIVQEAVKWFLRYNFTNLSSASLI